MNQDQVLGMLRNILAVGGGYAIGHGWLNDSQAVLIGGAVTSLAPLVWTYFAHTDGAKIAAASALPEIAKIVVASSAPRYSAAAVAAGDTSQVKVTKA